MAPAPAFFTFLRKSPPLRVRKLGSRRSGTNSSRRAQQEESLPALDDKRVAGWNALAVSGFAVAARALSEPRYLEAARVRRAFPAERRRLPDGVLARTWKDGEAKIPAFLEDEAFLALALLDLADAEGPRRGRDLARGGEGGGRVAPPPLPPPGRPGLHLLGRRATRRCSRNGRDLFDKAVPSASGAAARALARLALVTGDRALAREAKDAVDEVSWLMTRSPHGMESWFFALEALFEFEDKFGEEKREISSSGKKDGASASEGPVRVEGVAVEPRVPRGKKGALRLRIAIAPGWHLQGPDGLRVEASAGSESEFTFEEILPPPPERIEDTGGEAIVGWHGTLEANISFLVSRKAKKGKREIAVRVAHRACGEGACRPEAVVSLPVTVEIV